MFPNSYPRPNFNFSEWRQIEEKMEPRPFNNQRNGVQQPRLNNQPVMSFSSGLTNFNFWGSGPVSVSIYTGENSHVHLRQTIAHNYLQPDAPVQSPPDVFSTPTWNCPLLEAPNYSSGFPSPSFSDTMSLVSIPQDDIRQVPSTPTAPEASSNQSSAANCSPDVHRLTPHYTAQWFEEFNCNLAQFRESLQLEEEQKEASEQNDPVNSNGSAVAGASVPVPNPNPQRSRHTAAPVSRPVTRAYSRQQNKSV